MLIGHKSRNHPQQVAARGLDEENDDRRTPAWLFEEYNARHRFTLDAAASAENTKCPLFCTQELSGLTTPWSGRVWCNPPYSDIRPWVEKAWAEVGSRRCDVVVMLLPANRTDQVWWQELIEPYRDRPITHLGCHLTSRFLPGRIRFGRREGVPLPKKGDRPPFGSVVLTWNQGAAA